jgi:hypothetical protein
VFDERRPPFKDDREDFTRPFASGSGKGRGQAKKIKKNEGE